VRSVKPESTDHKAKANVRCYAKICLREAVDDQDSDGVWERIVCASCGARNIHIRCGGLDDFVDPLWYCYGCRRLVREDDNDKESQRRPLRAVWGAAKATKMGSELL